ncbi:MAG: hypothetical protein J6V72_09915 [Kiritimatiellae bacterium]|nr:hypothetical protein [Kiritimatiellia bacterium]
MKLRLMICAMAASAALFAADYVGDNPVYGVLGVTDTACSNTVVGVPWVSATGEDISLSNLVSAASLEANDILYLYDTATGQWCGYQLLASGVWDPLTTVKGNTIVNPPPADEKALARGTGMILQRAHNANPIYLCGRVGTGSATSSITAGTSPSNTVQTLFANAGASDLNLNTAGVVGGTGDRIIVPQNGGTSIQYEYKNNKWGRYTKQSVTKTIGSRTITLNQDVWTEGCTIPAGTGAWYMSAGGSPTITWQ